MAKKGALKPASFDDIRDVWIKPEVDGEKAKIDPEDQRLYGLSNQSGWKTLKAHIENLKIGLDKRLAESVLKSMGDDQIKMDAMFSVLGKELLDSIINKVEDSASVVEEINNEKQSGS